MGIVLHTSNKTVNKTKPLNHIHMEIKKHVIINKNNF